jgi:hypothetical protein
MLFMLFARVSAFFRSLFRALESAPQLMEGVGAFKAPESGLIIKTAFAAGLSPPYRTTGKLAFAQQRIRRSEPPRSVGRDA